MLDVSYKDYCLLCVNCKYGIEDTDGVYICSKKEHMGYFDEDPDCEAGEVYTLLNEAVSEAQINEDLEKDIASIVHNMVGSLRSGLKDIQRAILKTYRKFGYDVSDYSPKSLDIKTNL